MTTSKVNTFKGKPAYKIQCVPFPSTLGYCRVQNIICIADSDVTFSRGTDYKYLGFTNENLLQKIGSSNPICKNTVYTQNTVPVKCSHLFCLQLEYGRY